MVGAGSAMSAAQSADALLVLQSMYTELIGWGAFGRENDLLASGDWTALPNQRVRMDDPNATLTIPDELPQQIFWPSWWQWNNQDYWTWPVWPVCCDTPCCVPPPDLSIVTMVDPTNNLTTTYIYDAFVGRWAPLTDLVLSSEAPLSRRWFEPLANVLAERICGDYGQTFAAPRNAGLSAITMRFSDVSRPVVSEYC